MPSSRSASGAHGHPHRERSSLRPLRPSRLSRSAMPQHGSALRAGRGIRRDRCSGTHVPSRSRRGACGTVQRCSSKGKAERCQHGGSWRSCRRSWARASLDAPMVGREAEIQELRHALTDVETRAELPTGDGDRRGGGRQERLIRRFQDEFSGRGKSHPRTMSTYGETITFGPLAKPSRRRLGSRTTDPKEVGRQKITALVSGDQGWRAERELVAAASGSRLAVLLRRRSPGLR